PQYPRWRARFIGRRVAESTPSGDARSERPALVFRGCPTGHRKAGSPGMLDIARTAVEAATKAGADYADARAVTEETESLTVKNQEMEGIDRAQTTGV